MKKKAWLHSAVIQSDASSSSDHWRGLLMLHQHDPLHQHFSLSLCVCVFILYAHIWGLSVRAHACVLAKGWIIDEQGKEWKRCRTGRCVWECVEMGERNTVKQEPGYDGLCNYAQKITSCFGLDGKKRGNRWRGEGGGGVSTCVKQDAKTAQTMKMRGMCFSVCYADLSVCRDSWLVFWARMCWFASVCVVVSKPPQSGWQLEGSASLQQSSMSLATLRSMCLHVWVLRLYVC